MSPRLRVALAFGGPSVEHEVSVVSARGVAAAMRETPLECVPIAVSRSGRWLGVDRSRAILDGEAVRVEDETGEGTPRLAVEPGSGLVEFGGAGEPQPLMLDVFFPLVHGWGGEDGRFQGALDLAGIPCVGSGVLGSAVAMDKALARRVFESNGLSVAPWRLVERIDDRNDPRGVERALLDALGLPLFVKPANGGSSVGISKVSTAGTLRAALELALAHDRRAVVERAVEAREIECAVLGNEQPAASGLGEILPSREFYDYEAKYVDGTSGLEVPARLDDALAATMRDLALRAYRALDLAGFARVDFLLDRRDSTPYVNEVNTLPGFTPISMFPKLWEAEGLAYPRLIERLVELALERSRDDARRCTRREDNPGSRAE